MKNLLKAFDKSLSHKRDDLWLNEKKMSLNEQQVGNLGVMNSNQSSLLMQQILERNNLHRALKQVQRNKGAPGVDGMTVDDLPEYLKHNWLKVREALLNGTYKPKPVRRVEFLSRMVRSESWAFLRCSIDLFSKPLRKC